MTRPPKNDTPPVRPLHAAVKRVTVDIPDYLQAALAEIVANENSTPEAIMLAALECYVAEYLPKIEPDDDSADR
jgi:hypothetical protein